MQNSEKKPITLQLPASGFGPADDVLIDKIKDLVVKWVSILGLEKQWDISFGFDEPKDTSNAVVETRYRDSHINFNLPRVHIYGDDDDLEELVIHELAHIFTMRLWNYQEQFVDKEDKPTLWIIEDLHEEATTLIAWSLQRAFAAGRESLESDK